MKFASTIDELHHWLGLLTVDIQLGAAQRHLNAELRLCWLLVDKLQQEQEEAPFSVLAQEEFTRISIQLLDFQRALAPKKPGPKGSEKGPRLRLVGA